MKRRQFFTFKFQSARLKESNYNINLSLKTGFKNKEVIGLFDNQFLRSIRHINDTKLELEQLDIMIGTRNKLRKKSTSKENINEMKRLTEQINSTLYVPEYITVVIEHNAHYRYLFENGLMLNGKKYVRFSSSAGQGRKKTIVMVEEEIGSKLFKILNNDRKEIPLAPSKFNAYFGLNSSATLTFSTPRITIIPDYYSSSSVTMNWVTETDWESDDIIEEVEREEQFNRFDGMGLITPSFAKQIATELDLDYTPAQFCIRQNFTKGMLCTFDILDFCSKKNGNDTIIKDIYGNEVDLKNVDIILTESMCKLWNAFDSTQDFVDKCEKNNLQWGVSIHTPKEDEIKNVLKMNYQFVQTLDLSDNDIEELCKPTVDWLQGVTGDNMDYTKLFLMGTNPDFNNYNNYMYKCLFAEPELINDKYINGKIKDLLRKKIDNACLGEVYVNGNFQVLVIDPYALMQHCCGLEVTGLLGKGEYFSHYWNKRGAKVVDSMRSPMTYRSEHVLLDLVDNDEVSYWYQHCYCGIIVNIHGHETLNWSGADADYDILATTDNKTVIEGVCKNEHPVVGEVPKPSKTNITKEKLYVADIFTFGSIIGSITNKSTSGFALLPHLEKVYGKDSKEYITTLNRIQMCTKLQANQIDKSKIGQNVKGIPNNWVKRQKIDEDDDQYTVKEKEFLNSILLDRHPYFFTYLYKDTKKKYKKHYERYNIDCYSMFGISLNEMLSKVDREKEEDDFLLLYHKYSPVIDSQCAMNKLCRHIESVKFDINKKFKINQKNDIFTLLFDKNVPFNDKTYRKIEQMLKKTNTFVEIQAKTSQLSHQNNLKANGLGQDIAEIRTEMAILVDELYCNCSNEEELLNYIIVCAYKKNITRAYHILWNGFSEVLFERLLKKNNAGVNIPYICNDGKYDYLGSKYDVKIIKEGISNDN